MEKNKKIFVDKANAKHNNKYNYDKFIYVNSKVKGIITCPVHGDFLQIPNTHILGSGCPSCVGNLKYTNESFIQKAKEVHGDKYDYSKVNYTNSHNRITITCPIHNDFEQKPYVHLKGHGCFKCMVNTNTYTLDDFVNKAKEVHGDKYDYSKVNFSKAKQKILITCPVHGDFQQKGTAHLSGHGCKKCSPNSLISNETFIERSKKIHGALYDYSETVYTGAYFKVNINCKKHGIFKQTARDHLHKKAGCPVCKASKGEMTIKNILDKHKISYEQQYTIPEIMSKLRYDFYLPEYRLLIEFHGKQHYEYIPFFHRNGEDDFLEQKNRDDIIKHNAKFYKYKYLEFNYKQLKDMTKEEFEELVVNSIKKYKKVK